MPTLTLAPATRPHTQQLKDLTKTYKKCLKKYDGLNDTPRQELLSGGRRT